MRMENGKNRAARRAALLLHEFIDGLTQLINGSSVSSGYRIHHAVAQMVLQDHLACIIQGRPDRGQLDQHLGAIVSLLHHPLHLFQVADGAGQTVNHRLLIFVNVTVGVGNAMGMEPGMVVLMVVMLVVVVLVVLVMMFAHYDPSFCGFFPIIRHFAPLRKPPPGIFWEK